MDFSFSKSEKLLQKSARDFLEKECIDIARDVEDTMEGYCPKTWHKMAELGWMGIGIPSEFGGLGGDFSEIVILLEEMGRVLLPGPFIPSVVCSGQAILQHGSEAQKKEILPDLAAGKLVIVPAIIKPEAAVGMVPVDDSIKKDKNNFVLRGTRLFVPFAHMADRFIFSMESAEGPVLFMVDAKNPAIKSTILNSTGSEKFCEVVFENITVNEENILGGYENGENILKTIAESGSIAHCSYILGVVEKILEKTVEYAKKRTQFQRPIASFQVIAHQLADMALQIEQVKYLTYHAGWKISSGLPYVQEISMAKARASDAARDISLYGVKIHGGLGLIDEYDMQLYFRKAKAHEIAFGDADFHREIVADEIGLSSSSIHS